MTQPELKRRMAAYLCERGIAIGYAERAGWRAVDDALAQCMGFHPALPGIVIPYLHPVTHKPHPTVMRLRYFDPPTVNHKLLRYVQPRGSGVEAYFDPNIDWPNVLTDTRLTIAVTEGEAKALHLNQRRKDLGAVTVALGGVWSFLEPRQDNRPRDLTPWLRAMRQLGRGRNYVIAFDSDMGDNVDIQSAAETLGGLLSQ